MRIRSLVAGAFAGFSLSIAAFALPVHNVPAGLGRADYVGRVDPAKVINLTVILKMHDQAAFDRAVEALYDPASPTFQHWFTEEDFAKYAPTQAEFNLVRSELARQGFSILDSDPGRLWIRVRATARVVETAFQTELHNFSYEGRVFQTHTRDAALVGPANELIETVSGIERHQARTMYTRVRDPRTGKPLVKVPLTSRPQANSFLNSFTNTPLTAVASTGPLDTFGGKPTATYKGYQYAANGKSGAFTPQQLQAHYGFPFTQTKTYDGTGQTIALVEGYGYSAALNDANTAASLFGLPKLVSGKNFSVIQPEGPPPYPNAGYLTGWNGEIALDIQSAHAIAPGAKILVVASAGQDNEDQIYSLNYIISKKLANAVSNSWENDAEIVSGTLENQAFASVLKAGAAAGIAFNFSTGDSGDLGIGSPVFAPMIPSDSPYATGVGGTTIINIPGSSKFSVLGWGTNILYLYEGYVIDPVEGYFNGGAGGGQSQIWAKPTWQNHGSSRMVPDVAALADPFTGFPVVVTESNGKTYGEIFGGTSLACPIFTAIWAIADQYHGGPLGQAAPYLYQKHPPFIDATPPSTSFAAGDVTGSITDTSGTHTFTATTLFTMATDLNSGGSLNLYKQWPFLSALWEIKGSSYNEWLGVSFGTDSSLTIGSGWDYATGLGEPKGKGFVQAVTGQTTGK